MKETSDRINLVAYDPSLINLGFAYGYIENNVLAVAAVGTFNTDSMLKSVGLTLSGAEQDVERGEILAEFIAAGLWNYHPTGVVMESAYFNGRNPASLMSQSKASGIIQHCINQFNKEKAGRMGITIYSPNFIKSSVGVLSADFKDKTAINRAIEARIKDGTMVYLNEEDLPKNQKDHGNDAVAMLYAKFLELKENGYT